MKKLMIAAAIACAAAFANAATATWGIGYINDVSGDLLTPSATDYIATFNIYSDSALSTLVTSASGSDWDDGYLDGGQTADLLDNSTDTTYYGQIIVSHAGQTLTSDGFQFTTSTFSDTVDVFIMTATDEIMGIEKIGGGAFSGANGAFATAGGGSGWTAAPEPTSGLLLLLGMAGLALKRKRA